MTLIRLLAGVYWYAVMPLLLGMTWNKVKKVSKPQVASTYMEGYLIWFALFFVANFYEYQKYYEFSYWKMTRLWKVGLLVLTLFCLLVLNKTLIERIQVRLQELKKAHSKKPVRNRYKFLYLAFILTMISVLFVNPSLDDDVIERGNILIEYDTIRVPDGGVQENLAKQGIALGAETTLIGIVPMKRYSYPELFYTIPSGIFRTSLSGLVHMSAAFGLLLFFFSAYRSISRVLYEDEKKQNVFMLTVVIFYFCMIIADVHLALGVFQNIWNPMTLTFSCLFPIVFSQALEIGMLNNKKRLLALLPMVLCAVLSAQLYFDFGAGLCIIPFSLGLILHFVRRGR